MEAKLELCKNCGFFKISLVEPNDLQICPACGEKTVFINEITIDDYNKMSEQEQKQFVVNYIGHEIKPTEEEKYREWEADHLRKIYGSNGKTNQVTCPYCKATNVKKISYTKRAVKIGLFGIFGALDDAGKTYQCGNCGGKF